MVPHSALINALRALGYTHKGQTNRVLIYKKKGSIERELIRRNQHHAPEAVRSILRRAGMESDEIERFLSTCASSGAMH